MSFRLTTIKTISKLCSSSSNTASIFKKISPSITLKQATPTLYYTQSRGIFWNEKGEKQTQQENSQKENETASEEVSQKQQKQSTDQASAKQTPKKEQAAEETFDVLLENPVENRKKLHALWLKLEKEASEKTKELKKTKSLVDTLEAATNDSKQKIEDLRSRLKEEIEERELMRKRFEKEIDQSKVFAITKFAKDIIEVPDNLERALEASKHLEGKGDNLYEGVKSTHHILLRVLERHGVKQINPLKQKFDPNFHEALFDFVDPSQTPGTCGVIANVGYLINERVLRPAKVGVVKPPSKIEDKHTN